MKTLIKRAFNAFGYSIERYDPLLEMIPGDYQTSRFLPRVYRGALDRYLYFLDQLQSIRVLRDGRVGEQRIRDHVRLVKGLFHKTLPTYSGRIARLHLDCDLFESYMIALETLYDKVAQDGLIMFDEYDDPRWPGARKAIEEFFRGKPEQVQAHPKCD